MAKRIQLEDNLPVFQRTELPNGVRIISEHIPSVRSVAIGVWVDTGSRDETDSEWGISHFIEHMVFKGTTKRRTHHIAQRLESVGGYLNAFTTKEHTCFYARALDNHLIRALDLLLDLVLNPVFPEKELEKEKEVVIEEMRMYEDSPEDTVFDAFEMQLYGNQPLGRPIIGTDDTVRAFTQEQLFHYMDKRYTPNNIVIAMSGNINHQEAVAYTEKMLLNSKRKPQKYQRAQAIENPPSHQVLKKTIQQAHIVIGTRGIGVNDTLREPLILLNMVLGGGMSSRLNMNIRERFGYCYNIYSFMNMFIDTGDFGIYMGTEKGKVEKSKDLIFKELEKIVKQPLTDKQLTKAKLQLKGSLMLGLEGMNNRMMRLGRSELYYRRYFTLDEVIERIDAITTDELEMLATKLFVPENFTSVVLQPLDN